MENLTNQISVIEFSMYGDTKTLVYNGAMKDAKTALKGGYGVPVTAMKKIGQYTCIGYLPAGTRSIEDGFNDLKWNHIADWHIPMLIA